MSDSQLSQWVWQEGRIRVPGEARIDVYDHGFLYGDSVYETLRTHGRRLFALDEHLKRLEESAQAIGLALPGDRERIAAAARQAAAAGPDEAEAGIRVVVTRGVGPLGIDPTRCRHPALLVFGWAIERGPHPLAESGVSLVVSSVRRNPPSALDPRIKSGNFLNNILAYREAREQGAYEALLLTTEGTVAEGTTSNAFWVRGGEVWSSDDEGILRGVTRRRLLELMAGAGIPCHLGRFPLSDLEEADEIFISSTLKGVLPVTRLDGRAVGDGRPGPLTRRVAALYEEETARHARGEESGSTP